MSLCIITTSEEPHRILVSVISRRAMLCPAVTVAEQLLADGILLQEVLKLRGYGTSALDSDIGIATLTNVLSGNVSAIRGTLSASVLDRTASTVGFAAGTGADAEIPYVVPYQGTIALDKELIVLCAVRNGKVFVTRIFNSVEW